MRRWRLRAWRLEAARGHSCCVQLELGLPVFAVVVVENMDQLEIGANNARHLLQQAQLHSCTVTEHQTTDELTKRSSHVWGSYAARLLPGLLAANLLMFAVIIAHHQSSSLHV